MTLKKLFLLTIFLFFICKLSAQTPTLSTRLDSLLRTEKNLSGEKLFYHRMEIIDILLKKNLDSAGAYIGRNLKLSQSLEDPVIKANALKYYGLYLFRKGRYEEAVAQMERAIEIEKQNGLEKSLAETYRWLAGIYQRQGNLEKSIQYLYESIKIYDKVGDYRGLVSCYNNLGILEKDMMRYNKSVSHYRKALEIIGKYHIPYDKSVIYTNLGIVYRYLKQTDSSYYYFRKSLDEVRKQGNFEVLVKSYLNMSKHFIDTRQKDSVEYYFNKLKEIFDKIEPSFQPTVLSTFGKWYYQTGRYDRAIGYLKRAYEIGRRNKSLRDKEYALYYLYVSYKDKGDYKNSLRYLEELTDVQDSVKREEAQIKIEQLQKKFEDEKKQLIISQLEKDKAKQKKIKYLLAVILVLLSLIFLGTLMYYKKQRKLSRLEKEKMQADLEYKSKQLTSQALMMMQKNRVLNDILQFLSRLKKNQIPPAGEINQVIYRVKSGLQAEKDWEVFRQYFEMVNKDFFKKLKQQFPDLTQSELKLSALIKLRFNIKQSAAMLNISPDSVKTARYVLRKKFGLKRNENLYDFLSNF